MDNRQEGGSTSPHDQQEQPSSPWDKLRTPTYWPRLLLLVVVTFSLVNYAYNAILNPAARIGVDFPANYLSAEMVKQGSNPYDQEIFNGLAAEYGWAPQRVTPFVYHPLFAWLMTPLTLVPPEWANVIWILLCQAALWGGVGLLGLALSHSKGKWFAKGGRWAWAVGTVLLVANFRPLYTSFQSGRVDAFVFLLIALTFYLLARNKDLWAGLSLGVVIMLKVTPGLLLLYLVATRRWRAVAATVIVCILIAALSVPLLGWETNYTFWIGVLPSLLLGPDMVPDTGLRAFFERTAPGYESFTAFIGKLGGFKYHNQSLSGLFHGLFDSEFTETIAHSPITAQLLSTLTMLLVLGALAWVVLRRFRAGDDEARRTRAFDLGFALTVTAIPLISSVAWEHHFSPLILTFSLIVAYALRYKERIFSWSMVLFAVAYAGLAVGYAAYIFDLWGKGVWVFGLYGRAYAVLLLAVVVAYLTLREKGDPILQSLGQRLHDADGRIRWGWIAVLFLIPLLLLALSLRLAYAQNANLYVDEYTSLLAARYTAQHGVPRTPTGAYYTRGLLFTYLETAVLALGPFSKMLARLPSVLVGTGTVLALFAVGRRMFSSAAALLAATWLVFAPEAIIWGGRARMYALLQLFVLLAGYCFYKGVIETRRDGARHLFILFFLAALFTQMETILLLPAFGVAWVLWQKPRDWLRPAVWLDVALIGIGVVVRLYLHQLMILPGLSSAALPRPFIAIASNILEGWQTLSPYFASPDRYLMTGLFIAGIITLIALLVRKGWTYLRDEQPAAAFLAVFLLVVVGAMIFAVGESWRHPRYLFLVLPWFFLAAAAAADTGIRWLWNKLQGRWSILRRNEITGLGPVLLIALVVVVVGTALAPRAVATTRREGTGYDPAFAFVRQEWQPGDAVATIVPSASLLFLDQADYLAIEKGYEGYSIEKNGQRVETWSYIPLLESVSDLDRALAAHNRLWLVIDQARLDRHFSPEFVAQVWERMNLVDYQLGVLVFRSGPEVFVPEVRQSNNVNFNDQVLLVETGLETSQVEPGGSLRLAQTWQAQEPLNQDYVVFVHLDSAQGDTVAVADGPATGGSYPMYHWESGQEVVDRREITLPENIPLGRYQLNVGLYQPDTKDRLPVLSGGDPERRQATAAFVQVGEPAPIPAPSQSLEAVYNGQICLMGFDIEPSTREDSMAPGGTIALTLHWQACGPVEDNYHVFVHLVRPDGEIVAQGDAPPLNGAYPTSFWQPDEVLLDTYQIEVPLDAPAGDYALQVGLYQLETSERLPVEGGGDKVHITTVEVQP